MKEYKFIRLYLPFFSDEPDEDYQEIITQHAKQGWSLVQIFAPALTGHGRAKYFELIFETDLPGDGISRNTSIENPGDGQIAKITCPNCQQKHDIDYPKCPFCGHNRLLC